MTYVLSALAFVVAGGLRVEAPAVPPRAPGVEVRVEERPLALPAAMHGLEERIGLEIRGLGVFLRGA